MNIDTLIQKQVDFLTVQNSTIPVESFLKTQPVHCQRFVEPRTKGLMKILSEKLLPTHLEVALVQVHFTDGYYVDGQFYSINGNTRKELWSKHEDLRPFKNLYATVYHAFSELDVEQIYRSIDSSNSVETKKHMIGGLCRATNFVPQSNKVRTGNFATALRRAYICCTGINTYLENSSYSELENKKEFTYFEEEIKYMDKFILSFEKDKFKNKKFSTGPIMAALLIMGKKYGVNNPKFIETFDALVNERVTKHDGTNGLNDGVSVVWKDLYEKNNPVGRWTLSSEGYGPVIIGHILYCLDAYMRDELLKIRNYQSTRGIVMKDDTAIDYYRNYFTH